MDKGYKNCQSCGMPLKKDILGGGTNTDGTTSHVYCSHCFQKGEYTNPDIDLTGMKELVKSKLIEFGIPKFLTNVFTRNIKNLKRWK